MTLLIVSRPAACLVRPERAEDEVFLFMLSADTQEYRASFRTNDENHLLVEMELDTTAATDRF